MKMIEGSGLISNYKAYVSNCTQNQMPYKIPVSSLADVQLYINIGTTQPTTVQYELLHTCGPFAGITESITPDYVVAQDKNNNWYGVFKNFTGASTPVCFVVAITLDSQIYFSEEYCIENCDDLTLLKG